MKEKISIMWFRRDLRTEDNHALSKSLLGDLPVLPVFIFDTSILAELPIDDHRVSYIHGALTEMNTVLSKNHGSSLAVFHGKPVEIFNELSQKYDIDTIYTNHDYEPYAKKRDTDLSKFFEKNDVEFLTFKDQVIFEKSEVTKDDKKPYVVYTPYMRRWKVNFDPQTHLTEYSCSMENYMVHNEPFLSLADIGFTQSEIPMQQVNISQDLLDEYGARRNFPAQPGTSHVGTALRFGTISVRKLMKQAITSNDSTFMNELIWREFFMQILWHFPHTVNQAFREKYDFVQWRNAPDDLQKWKDGQTGYPMVDAGMRELNTTGYMHNRVRMVVASFLCKHLLIHWKEGERYFAEKLFDYELSSNVGNWQWAAGSGVDAAPYFRVFNPETQMNKFDPDGVYVRKWVPEYFALGYVTPIVEHRYARERALETYKDALNSFDK